MAPFWKKNKQEETPEALGRIAAVRHGPDSHVPTMISGFKHRTTDLLGELRSTPDVYRAIELLSEKHPDMSMAVQSYIRLANNGHEMEFYNPDGSVNTEVTEQWKVFASEMGGFNVKGIDGLVDQIHDSQIRFGGVGCEISVAKRFNITGIHLILPQWLTWEMDEQGEWHAFQQQRTQRVEVTKGNFYWVPLEPRVGQPTGRLIMEPALMAIDQQLEFFKDSAQVLRRAGYPRNDFSIDREAVWKGMPAAIKSNPQDARAYMESYLTQMQGLMRQLRPTDDYIHYDDIEVNKTQGENSRTIDLRSYTESIDPQVMNGLSQMSLLLNRTTGQTETWGTVQYRIIIHIVESIQRGSKRFIENIGRFWAETNGYPVSCKFSHNPVDWQDELTKLTVSAKKQEVNRRAEEYGWLDKPAAAKGGMDIDSLPDKPPDGYFEYINKLLLKADPKADNTTEKNPPGEGSF